MNSWPPHGCIVFCLDETFFSPSLPPCAFSETAISYDLAVPCQGDADCIAVDGDTCTVGYCSDDGFCRHETSENCCGNGICEAGEADGCSDDCEKYFEVDSCNYYGDETVRLHLNVLVFGATFSH